MVSALTSTLHLCHLQLQFVIWCWIDKVLWDVSRLKTSISTVSYCGIVDRFGYSCA